MPEQTTFLLGIHNHQPVGNFPEVFEKGYRISYQPFLELIGKFPSLKWSLHLSGILWDFMKDKHPEYIAGVKKMCDDGRVEIMSGGYYEPILAVIPLRDRIRQIKKLNDFIKNTFGQTPRGIWLTERIWEPSLPKFLGDLGIEYTLTDDYHFLAAGRNPDELGGYYVTEDEGVKLNIFPISQKLRYYIPFEHVEKSIELMRAASKYNSSLTMGDDGEKFGMWPKTYEHVYGIKEKSDRGDYESGWLYKFFSALADNNKWLKTDTFSGFIDTHKPSGRIYLPTASYFEMSEWTLPAKSQSELESIIAECDSGNNQRLRQAKKFLRGGFWRNFLTKYQESNNMHKKMLYVSEKLNSLLSHDNLSIKKGRGGIPEYLNESLEHLMAGQCNCAYWHGVFGGLYLPHLRRAVYEELILAEKNIPAFPSGKSRTKKQSVESRVLTLDINKDGQDEIAVETPTQNFYINPSRGGCIYEWDLYSPPVNVANVLTRRYEAYHDKIKEALNSRHAVGGGDGVQTIHSIVKMKEKNLERYLNYDWYERALFQEHFLHPSTTREDFSRCKFGEQGDFTIEPYQPQKIKNNAAVVLNRRGGVWSPDAVSRARNDIIVEKRFSPVAPLGISSDYTIENLSGPLKEFVFAVEFNLAFFAGFPDAEYEVSGGNGMFTLADKSTGLNLEAVFDCGDKNFLSDARWWCFPIETVSLSEDGFERTLQGGCLALVQKLLLPVGKKAKFNITLIWK